MPLFNTHPLQNAKRLKEIANVIAQYGLVDLLEQIHISPDSVHIKKEMQHLSRGEQLRLIFQELGPTFIKFGQMISVHADSFPKDVIEELEKLQDSIPPFPYEYVEKEFLLSFRKSPEKLFKTFEKTPFASASIGQVHKATLQDNTRVVVKVQRPYLEKNIKTDIDLMYMFVELLERYVPESKLYELSRLVREFEKSILREIDFQIEADNLALFNSSFDAISIIHFPKVFPAFSNKTILTLSYMQGNKVQDIVRKKTFLPEERQQIARVGAQAICKQIFEDGFFHADPHGGNLLVQKNGDITFLDAGMVGRLTLENRRFLSQLLITVVERNSHGVVTALLNEGIIPDACDIVSLQEDVDDLFIRYYGMSLKRIDLKRALNDLSSIMFHYHIHLPPSFLLLIRTLIILEGVGTQLDPEFDPVAEIAPFAKQLIANQYKPSAVISDIGQLVKENIWTMRSLPTDLILFVQKLLRGKVELKLDHQGLEDLNTTIDKAGGRFSASIIIAGAIVASALLIHAHIPPLIGENSLLGLAGFVTAAVFGIRLLITIMKDLG